MKFEEQKIDQEQIRSLEQIVSESKSESVTLQRLVQPPRQSFLKRITSRDPPQGPFHHYVHPEESVEYLFHNCEFAVDDISNFTEDGNSTVNWAKLGYSSISPVTIIFTSKRVLLVYTENCEKHFKAINYVEMDGVLGEGSSKRVTFKVWTDRYFYYIRFPGQEKYIEEVEETLDFLIESGDFDEFHGFEEKDDGYISIAEMLKEELYNIKDIAIRADLEYVVGYGIKGAKIGALRSGYAGIVGFVIGSGYGLWKDLADVDEEREPPSNINPEETAQTMTRWKQAGEQIGGKKTGLVGAVIGGAVTIDAQTSGNEVSQLLSDSNINWIAGQIKPGPNQETSLKCPSNTVRIYEQNLTQLLDDDFFEKIEKDKI